MYLYLGENTVIRTCDVIGIFDLENTTVSRITRDYLASAQKNMRIIEVSAELPKSYVICSGGSSGKVLVYLSQISPATLLRRAAI
ncbi:MAG: DUF370 domain-containing protein [Oscillospiraceae bacterium]|nr:DUF370 domain-containing protein [Oscillospiraceae bacterium]